MKYIMLSIMAVLLTACSSTPDYSESMANPNPQVVTSRVDIVKDLDSNFCAMEGFAKFSESSGYYTFKCNNGGTYRIPK
jgi:putative hemolysin